MKYRETSPLLHTICIFLLFLAVLLALARHGAHARTYSKNIVTLGTSVPEIVQLQEKAQDYFIWKERGLHGRVLLHFDNIFDVSPPSREAMWVLSGNDHRNLVRFDSGIGNAVRNDNYVLFAMSRFIVRKAILITARSKYADIRDELRESGYLPFRGGYLSNFIGIPKVVADTDHIPVIDEPVLMDFHADFFSNPDVSPDELYDKLIQLKLRTDLITFTTSREDRDVTLEGVKKMERFIELLRGGRHGSDR